MRTSPETAPAPRAAGAWHHPEAGWWAHTTGAGWVEHDPETGLITAGTTTGQGRRVSFTEGGQERVFASLATARATVEAHLSAVRR